MGFQVADETFRIHPNFVVANLEGLFRASSIVTKTVSVSTPSNACGKLFNRGLKEIVKIGTGE